MLGVCHQQPKGEQDHSKADDSIPAWFHDDLLAELSALPIAVHISEQAGIQLTRFSACR
jgi:hypothetical protein